MVHGLSKFKEYFLNHTHQYVFIGGTACDILMDDLGVPFRATRDLDIVLISETLNSSFGNTFWRFIEDGGYSYCEKDTSFQQFYRFSQPKDSAFPRMIELFCRMPTHIELKTAQNLTPIRIDNTVKSLSAILINDDYYQQLMKGKRLIDGCSLINIETVILFKMKAWMDLMSRKEAGEILDSKDIKKHKNDIFKLLANVSLSGRTEVSQEIFKDIIQFIRLVKEDKPDLKSLGIRSTRFDEFVMLIEKMYFTKEDCAFSNLQKEVDTKYDVK